MTIKEAIKKITDKVEKFYSEDQAEKLYKFYDKTAGQIKVGMALGKIERLERRREPIQPEQIAEIGRLYDTAGNSKGALRAYEIAGDMAKKRADIYEKGLINLEEIPKKYHVAEDSEPEKERLRLKKSINRLAKEYENKSSSYYQTAEKILDRPDSQIPRQETERNKRKDLTSRLKEFSIPIVSFILALFFFSPNLTGLTVTNSMGISKSNWMGLVFQIVGILSLFFCLKNRKI